MTPTASLVIQGHHLAAGVPHGYWVEVTGSQPTPVWIHASQLVLGKPRQALFNEFVVLRIAVRTHLVDRSGYPCDATKLR